MMDLTLNLLKKENEIIRSLQKKKVAHKPDEMTYDEEEEFKKRKETGLQKAMSNYTEKMSQYKEKLKRKAEDVERESREFKGSQSENNKQFTPEIHTIKRMKTDFELECQSEEEEWEESEDDWDNKEQTLDNKNNEEIQNKPNIEDVKDDSVNKRSSIASTSSINKSITNISLRKKELSVSIRGSL